ncbi:hypothetical protein YC2023_061312 [Brassica napus]
MQLYESNKNGVYSGDVCWNHTAAPADAKNLRVKELQKHGALDMFMALVGNKADLHEKIWHMEYKIQKGSNEKRKVEEEQTHTNSLKSHKTKGVACIEDYKYGRRKDKIIISPNKTFHTFPLKLIIKYDVERLGVEINQRNHAISARDAIKGTQVLCWQTNLGGYTTTFTNPVMSTVSSFTAFNSTSSNTNIELKRLYTIIFPFRHSL